MKETKKIKNVSLAMDAETQKLLVSSAKKAGVSKSKLVRNLIDKCLDLLVNDGQEIPVIIRIPAHLKENKEEMHKYMTIKADAITNELCSE